MRLTLLLDGLHSDSDAFGPRRQPSSVKDYSLYCLQKVRDLSPNIDVDQL